SVFPGEFAWESRDDHGSVVISRVGGSACRAAAIGLAHLRSVTLCNHPCVHRRGRSLLARPLEGRTNPPRATGYTFPTFPTRTTTSTRRGSWAPPKGSTPAPFGSGRRGRS